MIHINGYPVIQSLPRPNWPEAEVVLVDRGPQHVMPFVVATVTPQSRKFNEWFWGHYFKNLFAAAAYFDKVTRG